MDRIIRCITADGALMASAIDSSDTVYTAQSLHGLSATASAALGRLLTGASMMGAMLKQEHASLTLRVDGGGPLGVLTAISDSRGNVRGCVDNPEAEVPKKPNGKLDVGAAVGQDGRLGVIRSYGTGEPYMGQVALVSGEIAEDLTNYYAVSEQIPTVCALGVLVDSDTKKVMLAGGLLIQVLPGALPEDIEKLEANVQKLEPVTTMLAKGMTVEQMCEKALEGFTVEKLDEMPVHYACTCSREKYYAALATLEPDELETLPAQDGKVETVCPYCCRKYYFTTEELHALARQVRARRAEADR
ncbi:Hsp33 family molecular chaperone HslO [Hominenteromicrobium sp.]